MRHMRSRRILAMLLALSMIFGLLTTTALADNEVDQNTSNVGESTANGTSAGGSGEGQSSGASEGEPSEETNKKDVPTEEETTPEEKKTTSSEEGDPQAGEGETPVVETNNVASIDGQGYASLDAAIQAAASGATVTLLDNVELTATLTISNKDITLDVDSNTLTVSVSNGDGIVVENATLTLASSGTGKYVFKCSARNSDGIYVNNTDASTTSTLNLNGDVEINVQASVNSAIHAYATAGNAIVNINGGKITATGSGKQFKAIHVDQNATLNMAGGELDITVDFDSYSDNNDVVGVLIFGNSSKQENCHVVISDGIFKVGGKNAFAQVVQVGMVNGYSENCDVSITGGTVKLEPTENGTGYVYAPYKASYATAAISGGTVTGTVTALVNAYISDVTNDGLTVTGGTFTNISADEMSKYLPEGTTYDETTGKVSSGSSEKLIETSEELAEAIANASDGDTLKLAAGEFTTYGNPSPKKSLTFVGSGEGTVWTIGDLDNTPGGEKNGDYSFDGCDTITFKNMTLKSDGADYRGFIRISNTIVDDCVLSGKTAYWGYETAKFINSKFNAPEGDYALWDYSSKSMSFDGCEFNISGKGVNVYVEAGNAGTDARKVEVKDCTVTSTKENKAFLNIKNSTQAYDVTISGNNTVNGLAANGTTGSNLYQVEATEITEASGKPLTVKQVDAEGKATIVYQVKNQTGVATVDGVSYDTLKDAFAALSDKAYTLTLNDESAWDATTPVYWAAGEQSGYAATLAEALTKAYMQSAESIKIVCRPNADVGEMTHGHVADNLTIYGNKAYISAGECDLEVDTYKYDRSTGKQVKEDGEYLTKDITITAYELDNLGVWGERHTEFTVNVNLTDCDGKEIDGKTNVQRVYISGETGVNNITLTGCDFETKATSVYSNADGEINITDCSFTGAQVPVNFNHKANGEQTLRVSNCEFNACGDKGEWAKFAAPVRFVNSGSGKQSATVDTCKFTDTVGSNGDILIGDGRTGQDSNDVSLTVTNTEANIQAQQPGYYNGNETDTSKLGTATSPASGTLTTSVEKLISGGSTATTNVAKVGETEYATLEAAVAAVTDTDNTITLLTDVIQNTQLALNRSLTLNLDGHTIKNENDIWGEKTYCLLRVEDNAVVTITGNGTVAAKKDDCYAISITSGSLTIENGTFIGNISAVQVETGSLTIKDGTFKQIQESKYGNTYVINCIDDEFASGAAAVAIYGGTFVGFDPNVSPEQKVDGVTPSFAAPGVGITKNADGTFTAVKDMTAQLLDADGNSVKAYTSLADAITAASEGQIVRLLADAKEDVTIDKNITLDLGGKTLTNNGAGKATITIAEGATATVKNGSVVGGTSYYNIQNNGTATFEGLTATAGNDGSSMIDNYGTLTITSGTYTGGLNVVKSEEGSTLVIKGGTFTLEYATSGYTGVIYAYGDTTITGGEFIQNLTTTGRWNHPQVILTGVVEGYTAFTKVTGGTFTNKLSSENIFRGVGKATSDNFEVSGGTFNKSIPEGYCADGFIPTKNADGTYGVKEGKYVAKVGSTGYETLEAAIKAVSSGKTVTLLDDITANGMDIKKSLTIDFNGKTLTVENPMVGSTGTETNAIRFLKSGKTTITVVLKNGTIKSSKARILIQNYANLTVDNMTLDLSEQPLYGYVLSNNNGTTVINNTTITAPSAAGSLAFDSCAFTTAYGDVSVTLRGSSVINGNVGFSRSNAGDQAASLTLESGTINGKLVDCGEGEGVTVTKTDAVSVAAPDGYKWVDGEAGQTLAKIVMVAEVNGKQYETLQEAIDAAVYGNTVTLLSDTRENVTVTGQTKVITLDLGGHILNGGTVANTPALTVSSKAKLTIVDSSKAQTGTIMREDTAANSGVSSHYVIDIQDTGSQLTFKSGNVKNNSGNADMSKGASLIRIGNDNTTAKPQMFITGGTFTQDNFIAIKVDRGTLTMNGGVINSKNTYAVENWYHTTINDGTINGKVSSWVWSGGNNKDNNLSINGGTIHGDIESVTYDGTETKTAKITINGGVIDGKLLTRDYNKGDITDATKATIGVVAGNFREDPTKFLVEGSTVSKNDEGRYDAVKAYLCKIGEKSYYTMDEALKAVKSGETIVLLRDCSTNKQATSGTKDFTIDLAEFTWNHTGSSEIYSAFEANNENGKITVKNGNVVSNQPIGLVSWDNAGLVFDTVKMTTTGRSGIETNGNNTNDAVTLKNSTLNVPNGFGIYFPSSGKLTIEDSTIKAKTLGVQVCSGNLDISGAETKIEVTGDGVEKTENDGAIQDGAAISIVNRAGYKGLGTITVTGGTFTAKSGNAAVKAYNWENKTASDFTASDKVAISGGSYSTPVRENLCAEGFVPVTNGDGTYGVQPDGNVAEIGSVKYTSLDEALKAAKDRETVKLLKDVEATQVLVTKGTLDLNGKTLKVSYFMSFSDVIDSTEGNGLIETGVQSFFTTNNSYLPLRDSAVNGYRLFSYKLNKLGVVEGSSTAFWFNIIFGGEKAYSLLNTAGHNADLFIPMQIGSGNEWQYIKMNQSTLMKWTTPILNGTAPSKCGYYVNITGLDTLTSGTVLTLKTSIRSCGVEKLSDDSLTYTTK